MKEYEMLRQEILDNLNAIVQYNTLLYTVTVAILAFAFDKENPFLCLIPYVAIIPIYLIVEHERAAYDRIGAYMIVFLEGTDYQWETRFYRLRTPKSTRRRTNNFVKKDDLGLSKPSRVPYLFLAVVCSICTLYKVIISSATNIEKWASIVFVVLLTAFTIIIMIRNSKTDTQIKDFYIDEWEKIKAAEEIEARKKRYKIGNYKNNRNPQ